MDTGIILNLAAYWKISLRPYKEHYVRPHSKPIKLESLRDGVHMMINR